jgi:hypothetical protein
MPADDGGDRASSVAAEPSPPRPAVGGAGAARGAAARAQALDDRKTLVMAGRRPGGDLGERAHAAGAQPRDRVQPADADAGGGDLAHRTPFQEHQVAPGIEHRRRPRKRRRSRRRTHEPPGTAGRSPPAASAASSACSRRSPSAPENLSGSSADSCSGACRHAGQRRSLPLRDRQVGEREEPLHQEVTVGTIRVMESTRLATMIIVPAMLDSGPRWLSGAHPLDRTP